MKKISLSVQITLVFLGVFIFTSILLGILITNGLEGIYINSIYEKLESEEKVLKQAKQLSNYQIEDGIAYIRYKSQKKSFSASDNISDFLDDNSIKLLINKAATQEEGTIRYVNLINDKTVYYIISNYQGFFEIQQEDIFIILTDEKMKIDMTKETTLQILLVSVIAFFLGYLIILLWVSKFIKDTKHIAGFLNKIVDNNYKTKLSTKRNDEIGNLVKNIEIMRNKIIKNEKQKQEIIQGVSHDLKTPIAIIQSYNEALKDNMCTKEEAITIIDRECKKLNNKITKLLHLTRLNYIDANNNISEKTVMKKLISEVVVLYNYQTKANIELLLEDIVFLGDKDSWTIVIENILDNAIRYANTIIRITLKENEFTIFNDNSHIEKTRLISIFNTYEKSFDGKFGLGLSIVKKTVEIFGFNITAHNIKDGVIFKILKNN